MEKLEHLRAVVTGGAKGIGKSLTEHLYREGASVVICGRDLKALEETCLSIDPTGTRCASIKVDVTKEEDCEKLIQFAVERLGGIDLLINNAGVYGDINEFKDADLEKWVETIEVNLLGIVYCTKFALAEMVKQRKGKIINLAGAGIGSKRTLPRRSAYFASKGAVVAFTETLAEEVAIHNIQVNAISPGAINTGFTEYLISQGPEKAGQETYEQAILQRERGGDDIEKTLDLVSFLVSEDGDHVSGRLLSAKWDTIEKLRTLPRDGDMFKLRRIDNDLFHGA